MRNSKGVKNEQNLKMKFLFPAVLLAMVFMFIAYYAFTEGYKYGKQLALDQKAEKIEINPK